MTSNPKLHELRDAALAERMKLKFDPISLDEVARSEWLAGFDYAISLQAKDTSAEQALDLAVDTLQHFLELKYDADGEPCNADLYFVSKRLDAIDKLRASKDGEGE